MSQLSLKGLNPLLISLVAFLFLLPIGEAPKNLAFAVFLMMWGFYAYKGQYLQLKITAWDKWIALLLLMVVIPTIFSELKGVEWSEVTDLLKILIFVYMVSKIKITHREANILVFYLVVSTVIASIYAIYDSIFLKKGVGLWLLSIGSENTSAVYLSAMALISASYLLYKWQDLNAYYRIFYAVSSLILLIALYLTGSRAGVGSFLIGMIFVMLGMFVRNKKIFLASLGVLSAVVISSVLFESSVYVEQVEEVKANEFLPIRIELWKYAYVAGMENPFFGLGTGNYESVTNQEIAEWAQEQGRGDLFDAENMHWHSHAHNIYVQAFVDRGLMGVIGLLLFLFLWFISMIIAWIKSRQNEEDRSFWVVANFSLIVVITSMGTVIDSFHHEPAMLVALFFGLLTGYSSHGESIA